MTTRWAQKGSGYLSIDVNIQTGDKIATSHILLLSNSPHQSQLAIQATNTETIHIKPPTDNAQPFAFKLDYGMAKGGHTQQPGNHTTTCDSHVF